MLLLQSNSQIILINSKMKREVIVVVIIVHFIRTVDYEFISYHTMKGMKEGRKEGIKNQYIINIKVKLDFTRSLI